MNTDTVVVVQARTGSSRLPGKVLAELDGVAMLAFQLERLAPVHADALVVATSTEPGDDAVAELAAAAGVDVVRGPEADVLGRFALVAERYRPRAIVRLTGDCPLSDANLVDQVVEVHRREAAHYTSTLFPRSFPKGLDVEVVRTEALLEAAARATAPAEREHVTPYLYRRPERFRMANVSSGLDLGQQWWVVDTAADLEVVRAMVARLTHPRTASWQDILAVVGTQPEADPGAVHLAVAGSSPTGSCPWERRWRAYQRGVELAEVCVAVGNGRVERRIDPLGDLELSAAAQTSISDALDRLLIHDEQVRC
jgi:spore coat polysaccharide biosynthesis protein SpsF